jgi:hypothetical protein
MGVMTALFMKPSGMFAEATVDDKISMQYMFMSQLAYIPIFEDTTNHAIGYKGLCFWPPLYCVDVCLDLGITCTGKCDSDT